MIPGPEVVKTYAVGCCRPVVVELRCEFVLKGSCELGFVFACLAVFLF